MDFLMKESSVQPKIGNVIVENTKESDTKVSFAINAELKSHKVESGAKGWGILHLLLL